MICAGNWKLNKSPKETKLFLEELKSSLKNLNSKKFIVFPPTVSLHAASEELSKSGIGFGCQNISVEESGAFTGETSINHIKELNCDYVLIGHSERRALYAESDEVVSKKTRLALSKNIKPIVCIGETLVHREKNQTDAAIEKQLSVALEGVSSEEDIILAYEPVWAIGTGKVASVNQVSFVHSFIKSYLAQKVDNSFSKKTPILYGGSVKPGNSFELAQVENVDGFLIGGASLQVESFIEVYKNSVSY